MRPVSLVGVSLLHLATSGVLYTPVSAWTSGGRSAWAWLPASYGRRCYHGSRSLSASVDSSRAGYYKTFEGAGVPEVDPILRSEVRERLRSKRREPFNKEMGQEVAEKLHSGSGMIPMRVLVAVELRKTLRLTRREKKARIFLPPEAVSDFSAFLELLYGAFPVEGFPHTLVARVRGPGAEESGDEEDVAGTREFVLNGPQDLQAAIQASEETGNMIQLVIKGNEAAQAAMVPDYLVGMPDPRQAQTMQMLSFYKFFTQPKDEDAIKTLSKRLRALWEPFGALGRIYVAEEGMNAQMAVPSNVIKHFEAACRTLPELSSVFLNCDRQVPMRDYLADPGFDALHIRVRHQVVADGGLQKEYDWADCGKPMDPEEWHQTVDDPNVLVFDCRNEFESEVGRFTSAEPLNTSFFRESWDVLKDRLKDVPKDKPILTYCTGGIRCIKVGAWLKQELGFTNVARLEGGIISYARHLREKAAAAEAAAPEQAAISPDPPAIPQSKFKGINYVFDNRLGERITDDVLARCDQCGARCDGFVNCANDACHVRFLQCSACSAAFHSCCSRGCRGALEEAKLRPAPGGYPAPPPKIWYPEEDVDTAPAAASMLGRKSTQKRRRPWLHPGAFQNVKLNLAFDQVVDACEAAETEQEPAHLSSLRRETEAAFPEGAHMVSGHVQGRLFATLARLVGAQSVLEIGTFTGYSALAFAEGLPEWGSVLTCEVDERAAKIAQKYFESSPHGHKIRLELGPAMDVLHSLASLPADERPQFDLIFIDGDKKRYAEYYDFIIDHNLLSKKGLIVADNVLWKGLVPKLARQLAQGGPASLSLEEYEPLGYTKRQVQLTETMHNFNMHVRADPRTEKAVLNLRDGLLFVRLKGAERVRLGSQEAVPQASASA